MKKALIFDPYLDTLGGGERYALSFANSLVKKGYKVDLAWPNKDIISLSQKRFGQDYTKINVSPEAFQNCIQPSNFFQKYFFQKKYDTIFWVSDGSFPFLFAKRNFLHFQVPFTSFATADNLKRIKSFFITRFVCNSQFTANVYQYLLPKGKLSVLYPPIDTTVLAPQKKENWILSVARFDSPSHHKRQDLLIKAFKKLSQKHKNYELFLVGGLKDTKVLDRLIAQAKNLKVNFVTNPDFPKLKSLYSKSRFFWHAAGFDVDESKHPESVEHFGMTTVEAMASGCIPIVIKKGGQKEIVADGQNGYLCTNLDDIATCTSNLIEQPNVTAKLSSQAKTDSEKFSLASFDKNVKTLIGS